jgi:CHAD domain
MAKATKVKGLGKKALASENAAKIIAVRLDDLYRYAPYVEDSENIEEIHNMRIAAKRLRYTLEMFDFAYSDDLKGMISEVKKIQSTIGDMRDADIMVETVLNLLEDRAQTRARRLRDIATSSERGTIAQRKQRIGEALAAPTVQRDDISYYTLVAHKADVSNASYQKFLVAWAGMQESDFYGRLRRFIGIDPPEEEPVEAHDEILVEEHIPLDESIDIVLEPAE